MTDDELIFLIRRLLEAGCPPTTLAKAFDVEVQPIRDLQIQLRIEKFGSAELAEAMQFAIWRGYENLMEMMESAPLAQRMRISMALVNRGSSLAGGATPDSIAKMQSEVADLINDVSAPIVETQSIYAPDPLDAPTYNPEKGPQNRTTRS